MTEQLKKHWHKYKFHAIFVAFLVAAVIIFWPYFSPGKALTADVYATNCSGDWFGVDRVNGAPEVSANGTFEEFNTENSAFYKSGFQSIVCQNFEDTELKENRKFISARIGLSLAINEIFTSNNLINNSLTPEEIINQEPEQNKIENIESNQKLENKEPAPTDSITPEPTSVLPEALKNFIKVLPALAQEDSQLINDVTPEPIPSSLINNEGNVIGNEQPDINLNQTQEEQPENKDEKILLPLPEEEPSLPQDDLTPVFLPPDAEIKINPTSTPEVINDQADAILNLRYSLDDNNYQTETFSSYPTSPALNGGYFYFDLPEIKSFEDLEKIKVSLEGLLGGDPKLISYLDSLWIEVTYEDEPAEIVPPTLTMDKNSWRSDEEPIIKINSQPGKLIKTDSFKKSLVKKLGILSSEEKIDLSLVGSDQKEIALDLDKDFKIEKVNETNQIKLIRPRSFKPGHYKLKYIIEQNGESAEVESDFEWGVLAINTNKSVYLSSEALEKEGLSPEQAYLQMAVLSDYGRTICDANLKLEIINPKSEIITLSTKEGTIIYSDSCGSNNVTDNPDYFTHYQVGEVGVYQMKLTNLDNGYEINDSFEVKDILPFEVERVSATRINPYVANYSMNIKIKANQDFDGKIVEQVPEEFQVIEQEGMTLENINGITEISWQEKIKTGEEITLRYEYDAPNVSPQLYLLGPLDIRGSTPMGAQEETQINADQISLPAQAGVNPCLDSDQCEFVFKEARQWQIAADTTNLLLFWAGSGGSCSGAGAPPAGWQVVSDGSFTAIFPRGNTSYAANNGSMGSATHTHTGSGTSEASSAARVGVTPSIANSVAWNHTHTVTVSTISTANSLPLYKDLCVIKLIAGGIPSGSSAIPQNAIAIFDASVPSGWSDYSSTFGTYYIRGNTTPGGTGGSNTHANPGHTISGTLDSVANSVTSTPGPGSLASKGHTHTFSFNSTDTPSIEPLSQNVILGQKTTSDGPLPVGMIGIFDGDPGSGWDIKSDASDDFNTKYIKVTGTYGNNSSGATTHTHSQVSGTSSSFTANIVAPSSATGGTITSHSHTVKINLAVGTNTNLPPYSDVVIAKKLGFTVSGTSDSSGTVKVAFDSSVQSESAVIGGGIWSITTANVPTINQIITVWIDGAADADESTAVTKYDGSGDSTGMVLNRHVLSLGSIDNPSLTVTDLNQYDHDQDEDIMHDGDSGGVAGALKVDEGNSYTDEKIDILLNATLTIATGESLTTHDVAINGSLTSSGTGIFNIDGSWDNNNDFNAGPSIGGETINFLSTTNETIDSTGATDADVYKVVLNGSGGQWTLITALVIIDDLNVNLGTLAGTQNLTVSGGDITGNGTINLTGGVVTLNGAGNFGGTTAWNFSNLTFGLTITPTATTSTSSNTITVAGVLTITANHELKAGSNTWMLSGVTGIPFNVLGTFTANTSTFNYSGNNLAGNTTITATTYYNLSMSNASEIYVLAGTTSVNGDLINTGAQFSVTASNYDLNIGGSFTCGVFKAQGGTVTFNGSAIGKTINCGYNFNNLIFNGSGGVWTLTTNNLDVNGDLTITAGSLIASTLNISLLRNLTIGASGIFTKGSGTFTFDSSTGSTSVMGWTDSSASKQDLGDVVVDGPQAAVALGSTVKATKVTIGSNDSLNLGTSSFLLTLTGSGTGAAKPLTINLGGTLTIGDSDVEYAGASTTDVTVSTLTENYYDLSITGVGTFTADAGFTLDGTLSVANGTFKLSDDSTILQGLHIDSGTFDMVSNYVLTFQGDWENVGGIFNAATGKVIFSGPVSTLDVLITSNSQPFYDVDFNHDGIYFTLIDLFDVNHDFNLLAGILVYGNYDHDIYFGGDTVFASGTTFTKTPGSGKVIFDGTGQTFSDNTSPQQNLGVVEIGHSPGDATLCTDIKMDSLKVNAADTFNTNGYDLDVTNSVEVKGILDATDPRVTPPCASESNETQINLGTNWTVGPTATFTADGSTVIFDGGTGGTLNSGGNDISHAFNNLTFAEVGGVGTNVPWTLAGYDLKINGNFTIGNSNTELDVSALNYNINVGGSWTNQGVFTARAGTVTFDAGSASKTIRTGGTGVGQTFYNIVFNNASGGWTITTTDLIATNNFSITSASVFNAINRTITINGNFTNLVGGAATKWTGSTLILAKTGGGSYTINTKTTGSDSYATFVVGADTDVRMWSSGASTYTIDASGSLYSMDALFPSVGPDPSDGALAIWGDYHTLSGNTDYWSYATDFDGTALGGSSRQALVYLQTAGATNPSVTVDAGGILNVIGGGVSSSDITIVGQDAAALWNFSCLGTCNVQESTWNYLNLVGGTLTVVNTTLNNEDEPDAGTLNVDWYLGDYVVDKATLGPIDTADTDIIISENFGSPASTVFKWSGSDWTAGATSQTTGTGANGKIPQPGTNGAIKIREYTRTSAGYDFYQYNLHINWQGATYGEYDYYQDYGHRYIISTLANPTAGTDSCISKSWQRNDMDTQNSPAQAIDEPPTNGTWYNGMLSGLNITIDDYSIDFGALSPGGAPIDRSNTITVSTSAANGYVVYLWSTQKMTSGGVNTIDDWTGTNSSPTTFNAGSYGFGYSTNDYSLTGGTADRFSGPKFAGFIHANGGEPVADRIGPSSGEANTVTYRIAVNDIQPPGNYTTNIVYVFVPNY